MACRESSEEDDGVIDDIVAAATAVAASVLVVVDVFFSRIDVEEAGASPRATIPIDASGGEVWKARSSVRMRLLAERWDVEEELDIKEAGSSEDSLSFLDMVIACCFSFVSSCPAQHHQGRSENICRGYTWLARNGTSQAFPS